MESCQLGQAPLFTAGAKHGELEKLGEGSGTAGVGIVLACIHRLQQLQRGSPAETLPLPGASHPGRIPTILAREGNSFSQGRQPASLLILVPPAATAVLSTQ